MNRYRRLTGLILALSLFLGLLFPATAVAASNGYTDQFNYYVSRAFAEGLIPASAALNLDAPLTESDLLDFAFLFSKVKCKVDTDGVLNSVRPSAATDERAKVAAINKMLDFPIWGIRTDGELETPVNLYDSLSLFELLGQRQLAPFSPLFYYSNDPQPEALIRYNFFNAPYVAYHMDSMGSLMAEIAGLSNGVQIQEVYGTDVVTRRQFAAFCYMLSTMSVPKDPTGAYPGGISGDPAMDSYIKGILDQTITTGMNDEAKVKAIYDYMIYHCTHRATPDVIEAKYEYIGTMNPLLSAVAIAEPMRIDGQGVCDVFANVFRLLAIRLGFECNYVSGYYVNRNGSRSGHGWNQIKVNDEWYWVDPDIENTVFKSSSASVPSYYLFMKKDEYWLTNHSWTQADWPAATSAKIPLTYVPEPQLPSATPTAAKVLVNGSEQAFDAYNIGGNNFFKLRDLAYVLNGTEAGFDVTYDNATKAIALFSGLPYTAVGGELTGKGAGEKPAMPTSSRITLNGADVYLTAYLIEGNNYFKLRDIGEVFDFGVAWDGTLKVISIDTSIGYTAE